MILVTYQFNPVSYCLFVLTGFESVARKKWLAHFVQCNDKLCFTSIQNAMKLTWLTMFTEVSKKRWHAGASELAQLVTIVTCPPVQTVLLLRAVLWRYEKNRETSKVLGLEFKFSFLRRFWCEDRIYGSWSWQNLISFLVARHWKRLTQGFVWTMKKE